MNNLAVGWGRSVPISYKSGYLTKYVKEVLEKTNMKNQKKYIRNLNKNPVTLNKPLK